MKLEDCAVLIDELGSFSILERIDVGETSGRGFSLFTEHAFSILERIDVGETRVSSYLS